jgi:hypothetical protein
MDSASTAFTLRLGATACTGRAVGGFTRPRTTKAVASTCTEAVGNPSDGYHDDVSTIHRLAIHMADAQAALEQLGNRFE